MIAKNEAKTLPKCMASLKEFTDRGGEVILCDTGSTDGTAELARSLGCTVAEVGEKFITTIDEDLAQKLNKRFVVKGEEPIVKDGNKLFDFASARNFANKLATNDMICTLDADEAYSVLNIDKLNELIDEGYTQFEYQFVFAHDQWGKPAIQFVQSKFFNRSNIQWTGIVHEVLSGAGNIKMLGTDVIYLEHWQEPAKDHRGNYLVGLALDCYQNPEKDRQSHYLAREMVWNGHPKSAIKEFERHIKMDRWPAEKSQSMIFMGDSYGMLNQPEEQIKWYALAFHTDPNRRESLIKLARFYQFNNKPLAVLAYAKAALEIPWTDYYANDKAMYEQVPHELLYWGYGWTGNIPEAQKHIMKALEYQPYNQKYLEETKYYFEYPANKVEGWMTFPELQWIYNTAKRHIRIAEIGSWKGRSTHAWASGTKGFITAIDTWEGSTDMADGTYEIARREDVFQQFKENTKQFENIITHQEASPKAAQYFEDKLFDVVFIDATHTYAEVKADIEAWLPKAKMVIAGHDYLPNIWHQVVEAVDEKFGKPDGVAGSIWYKYLVPTVTFIVPTLGRPEGLKRCLDSIEKLNYPKELIQTIVIDGEGTVPEKVARGLWQAKGEYIVYGSNDVEFTPDSLYNALQTDKGLVAFNTGELLPDEGNICEHFIIKKDFIKRIGGEIFDTEFHHVGVDNLLWAKALKLGQAARRQDAIVKHYHFSTGTPNDAIYQKGWSKVEEDRALLAKKMKEI
jgi:glycosyltransferase involved in cell wall biosynthesis